MNASTPRPEVAALCLISLGGGLGSVARYAVGQAWPTDPGQLPYSTLTINLTGSLLLGLLVVAVTEIWPPHRLVRPFLGTGILGGYTTFSAFAVVTRGLSGALAVTYLMLSVLGGIMAASLEMAALRRAVPARQSAHEIVDPIDPELP